MLLLLLHVGRVRADMGRLPGLVVKLMAGMEVMGVQGEVGLEPTRSQRSQMGHVVGGQGPRQH